LIFVLDNYDSFTFNLVDYFFRCGEKCIVKKNDEISVEEIELLNPKAIVLSPGPNTPNEAGILLDTVKHFEKKLPLLGICLGHQAIGMHFNYSLIKAKIPMHGKTSLVNYTKHSLFENIPNPYEVMRYHSLLIQKKSDASELTILSATNEGEIMAVVHNDLPIVGLQFHPESILTKNGLQLLQNWLNIYVK